MLKCVQAALKLISREDVWCLLFQVISKDVISVLSREDVVLMTVTNFAIG